jgi:hypothetical protein
MKMTTMTCSRFYVTCILLIGISIADAAAQSEWSPKQQEVLNAIDALSASTAVDGGGADAYGRMLDDSFTRWTVGSNLINEKEAWVEGIRDWFDDGWRVSERDTELFDIRMSGAYAFTRRIVSETYLGPDGDESKSKAAVAEVWCSHNGMWLLLTANVDPINVD